MIVRDGTHMRGRCKGTSRRNNSSSLNEKLKECERCTNAAGKHRAEDRKQGSLFYNPTRASTNEKKEPDAIPLPEKGGRFNGQPLERGGNKTERGYVRSDEARSAPSPRMFPHDTTKMIARFDTIGQELGKGMHKNDCHHRAEKCNGCADWLFGRRFNGHKDAEYHYCAVDQRECRLIN